MSSEQEASSTQQTNEQTQNASIAVAPNYDIEDSDDDQPTVDEILGELKESEKNNSSSFAMKKVQAKTSVMTRTGTPSTSGSRTISTVFKAPAKENQEKRSISVLLESLEEDYRKSPAKRPSYGNMKRDFSLDSPIANSTVIDIDDGQNNDQIGPIHKSITVSEIHTEPQQQDTAELLTSDSDIESAMLDILTDDDDEDEVVGHSRSEENNMTSDKSSSNPSDQTTSGFFEESKAHPNDNCPIDANAENSTSSDGSKSLNKSKKHHQTTINKYFNRSSSSKMSTEENSMNETNDRGNTDLNSESNQLEALHMASEK